MRGELGFKSRQTGFWIQGKKFASISEMYLKARIFLISTWKHYVKNSVENWLWFLNSPFSISCWHSKIGIFRRYLGKYSLQVKVSRMSAPSGPSPKHWWLGHISYINHISPLLSIVKLIFISSGAIFKPIPPTIENLK